MRACVCLQTWMCGCVDAISTESGRCGPSQADVDRVRPMWTESYHPMLEAHRYRDRYRDRCRDRYGGTYRDRHKDG